MSKYRHVYDSGAVFRMTDNQYRKYLSAGRHRLVSASQYGRCIVDVDFNATRASLDDFADARAQLGLIELANERGERGGRRTKA